MKTGPPLLIFYIFYLLTVVQGAKAQIPRSLDSLTRFLQTAPHDSSYLRAQNEATILLTYKVADYVRADSLTRQQAYLAQKLSNWGALYEAYRNRANVYLFKADYAQTLAHNQQALQIAEGRNLPRHVIYAAMSNVIVGYDKLGQNELLIQAALRAIRYQEQHNIRPQYPTPHRLIGGALMRMGRGKEAIPYYEKAGRIFRELGEPRGIAIFENQLGDFFVDLKQPRQALPHYQESLKRAVQMKFDLLQFDVLDGLANAYRVLGKPAEGMPYATRALVIANKQQSNLARATALGTIGLIYKARKDDKKAESYLKNALVLATQENSKEDIKLINQGLADLFSEQQQYKLAFEFQRQKNQLIDSAVTANTNREVQRLLLRYETQKKEARIKLLQQEAKFTQQETERIRFRTNALLAVSILLLLLGGAVSAWLINRSRLRRLEESQHLRQQIAHDLHDDVGSTLSSISILSGMADKLLSEDNMPANGRESAQRMVKKIYGDTRQILESVDEIIWTINPGNDSLYRIALRLQEYAQPLMESKHIEFNFWVDPALAGLPVLMEVRRNLFLIGKEAISNSVKYSQATQATLRFEHHQNQLKVVIEDNGLGFVVGQSSKRTGQASMQQRARAMGGTLEVHTAPGQGTRLELLVNP